MSGSYQDLKGTLNEYFSIKNEDIGFYVDSDGNIRFKDNRTEDQYILLPLSSIPSAIPRYSIEFPVDLESNSGGWWWRSTQDTLQYVVSFIYNKEFDLFNLIQLGVETTLNNRQMTLQIKYNNDYIVKYTKTIKKRGKHVISITDNDTNFNLGRIPKNKDVLLDLYLYGGYRVLPRYFKLQ